MYLLVFWYCRSLTLAGDFLFKLFCPQSGGAFKEKQKALFYLAHTKNPYLKNIRTTLNRFITETAKPNQSAKVAELTFSDIVNKALYQSQIRYPKVKIITDLKVDIKLPFYAQTMFQVLWELIKNAKQASPANEAIYIRTYTKGTNWFCCEVEDRGPGMSRELMKKSSQLYWTTKKNSTGLGLVFVQSALSRIGGIMKLNSHVKEGGGFKVLLFIPKDYLFHIQNSLSSVALNQTDYEKELSRPKGEVKQHL